MPDQELCQECNMRKIVGSDANGKQLCWSCLQRAELWLDHDEIPAEVELGGEA